MSSAPVRGRVQDIVVDSKAVKAQVKVRLLLPMRFSKDRTRRWPVLYLLHGCCDTYVSWTRSTDIERLTRNLDVLVVMPDGGTVGFTATGSADRAGRPSTPRSYRPCSRPHTGPAVRP